MPITAKMVAELREMTGAGMMDCKKALVEADGDMNKAVEILRERLIGRGTDTEEAIERRVAKAASEMEFAEGKFDYVLINDDLQTAKAEAERVILDFLKQ